MHFPSLGLCRSLTILHTYLALHLQQTLTRSTWIHFNNTCSQLQAETWGVEDAPHLWLWLLEFAHKTHNFTGTLQPPALGCYCLFSERPGKPTSSSETESTVLSPFCPERHIPLWHTSGSSIPARSCSHRRPELAESLVYVSLSFQPQRDKHPNDLCYYIQQSKSSLSFTDKWNLRSEIWSVLRMLTCPLYLLLQEGPAEGHPLLKITQLPIMLGFCLHLDFTLICVQQLQFLLQLHLQNLALCFLCLIQTQLGKTDNRDVSPWGNHCWHSRGGRRGGGEWAGTLFS